MKNDLLALGIVLSISFSAAAQDEDNLIRVEPGAYRDTMLVCDAEVIPDSSRIEISGKVYLEGAGEQILFALIPTSKSDEHVQAFFNAWGFTPFGQVESHEQFNTWALIHMGQDQTVRGQKTDYTFVEKTVQDGGNFQPRPFLRIYDCQRQENRPDWTRQNVKAAKYFRGKLY